jgi:hypothetical protein
LNKINFTLILLLFFIQSEASWAQPAWEDNIKPKKDVSKEIEVVEPVVVEPVVVEPTVEEPKVSLPDEHEVDESKENQPDTDFPDLENGDD